MAWQENPASLQLAAERGSQWHEARAQPLHLGPTSKATKRACPYLRTPGDPRKGHVARADCHPEASLTFLHPK
eukprot:jgi/Mesen1/438/ME000101S10669